MVTIQVRRDHYRFAGHDAKRLEAFQPLADDCFIYRQLS
jgi:hypothetical protein